MLIPPDELSTEQLIYAAYVKASKSFDGYGIAVGQANIECDRAIWYAFRWVSAQKKFDGRMLRLFKTGHLEEERIIADLGMIGVVVTGNQDAMRMIGGHVRGKVDGFCDNVPEAPKTRHLLECKSMNEKTKKKLHACRSVKQVKPEHYGQCQLGMHAFGLTRALYVATCKNDDSYYIERVEYDIHFAASLLARLERIVMRPFPPGGICRTEHDRCGAYCDHRDVCFFNTQPRVHCRTCLHAKPTLDGDAQWVCMLSEKAMTPKEQALGCERHLFITKLVPGEVIDDNKEAGTITYDLGDGDTWTDGPGAK